jgi:hypothetical protein
MASPQTAASPTAGPRWPSRSTVTAETAIAPANISTGV